MRLLSALLLSPILWAQSLPFPGPGNFNGSHNGFQHFRQITIDHTLVPNTDQTNFPVLVSGTISATVANGGSIQHTVTQSGGYGLTIPADAVITSDSSCTTPVAGWEFEAYSATTGVALFWFNAGTVSHTADSLYYVCYGEPSLSTQQMTVSATYDANAGGVWHWPNGSAIQNADSTANGNTTLAATAITGEIDGGASATGGFVLASCCMGTNLSPGSAVTYEGWVNFTNLLGTPNTMGAYDNNRVIGTGGGYTLSVTVLGHVTAGIVIVPSMQLTTVGTQTLTSGTWYHLALTYSNATGLISYVNGVQDGMVAGAGATIDYTGNASLPGMRFGTSLTSGSMTGNIDEHRVSTSVRSADWLRTEYNNQSNPTAFAALGAEN